MNRRPVGDRLESSLWQSFINTATNWVRTEDRSNTSCDYSLTTKRRLVSGKDCILILNQSLGLYMEFWSASILLLLQKIRQHWTFEYSTIHRLPLQIYIYIIYVFPSHDELINRYSLFMFMLICTLSCSGAWGWVGRLFSAHCQHHGGLFDDQWCDWWALDGRLTSLHVSTQMVMCAKFTHWDQVMHICVNWIHIHWLRWRPVTRLAPGHQLNQRWLIVNWTLGNAFQWNLNRNTAISHGKRVVNVMKSQTFPVQIYADFLAALD